MAKRVTLPDITISSPKSVAKSTKNECFSSILPKYYVPVADISIDTNSDNSYCWFCSQILIIKPLCIETIKGNNVGAFCSTICRDSFASMVKSHIALREEPKVTLLPLVFYDNPKEVINIINTLRNKEGVYGSCFYKEKDKSIHVSLRSLL
ncbi:putative late transcription factor [Lumpy skin disease virus]|uniref:Viral late gene transcription factor 2 n=1 Tax=Lumpy skin disease virus TaxID=59509 RepID=Q77GC2_LSDV|nr:late transcription factor VLTF-2 [Lumpy skin disease virus NI-2490]AAK50863.1 LSDV trans-activator A1L-like protein [Lumpy skin disease virus]AAN02659.1 putative late transcription factor [Lumpy skin disease virus NW-LW]AAK85052.1 LSDV091 putative late transcription factor [Lumpy skin disease virus NI-2490]AAN02816.1 putative late transcription factor [Lumpy skin disease virus]AOE47667.1 late transcription factor VLTF-2 [Lumpy skin disease virus]